MELIVILAMAGAFLTIYGVGRWVQRVRWSRQVDQIVAGSAQKHWDLKARRDARRQKSS